MELIKFDEMKKTWYQIARNNNGNIPPSFELEVYKKMLDIFLVGEFYYYIINIANIDIEFTSNGVLSILGTDPKKFTAEFVFENMHPEDRSRFLLYEQKVTEFFNSLPADKVQKYKVNYDFRLKDTSNNYKWILHQATTIQNNDNGAVIRVLGVHTDITHIKNKNTPLGLSFLGLDGEPSFYNVYSTENHVKYEDETLSKREKEVLKLILFGKKSEDIAELLFISKNTVDTHRKNILRKTNCKNWIEVTNKFINDDYVML